MNTNEISYAQLNVSKHYTVESINKLINRLAANCLTSYYNTETKSIDIEVGNNGNISRLVKIEVIKAEIIQWIYQLPADNESKKIVGDNIDFIFNITQINTENGIIIKLYLY